MSSIEKKNERERIENKMCSGFKKKKPENRKIKNQ